MKNATFSRSYFYMNAKIKRNFQICISVHLRTKDKVDFKLQHKSVNTTNAVDV